MAVLYTQVSRSLSTAPKALLLDFGGVIFQTSKHPDGRDRFAESIVDQLERAGQSVDFEHVRVSLDSGLAALKHWKHASSRRLTPREMHHREIVRDFIASDFPAAAREVLVAEASELLDVMNTTLSSHTVRPGIPEVLEEARRRGIALGIVSNAHSGRSHRRLMAEHRFDEYFGVQVYSDEVGIRKPHPRMIELAATALGVTPSESWYVGDTLDRDVVAGRRAGVGAVIVTKAQHTDSPPFAVLETPDAMFPTPEGLAEALALAVDRSERINVPPHASEQRTGTQTVLFIDHGGVISSAIKDRAPVAEFATALARQLSAPGEDLPADDVLDLIAAARERYSRFKTDRTAAQPGEITPHIFWVEYFGKTLSDRQRALLEAEAFDLMVKYARVKSQRSLRPGITELLTWCRTHEVPVVVVSNTMSGRVVREECARHGLNELIGAYVCSDEVSARKPERSIVDAAIALSGADPTRSWFFGDKPQNDAVSARAAGIARRVMVQGGSTDREALFDSLTNELATHVVTDAHELLSLMERTHST